VIMKNLSRMSDGFTWFEPCWDCKCHFGVLSPCVWMYCCALHQCLNSWVDFIHIQCSRVYPS
jgi:hypothetical protein